MQNQTKLPQDLLLDTHVWLWLNQGSPELQPKIVQQIDEVATSGRILIPAISIWEIATLAKKGRINLRTPLTEWVETALAQPGIFLVDLSPQISIESTELPGNFHGDPADRLIVATARVIRTPVVTRDKRILDYGEQGFIESVGC